MTRKGGAVGPGAGGRRGAPARATARPERAGWRRPLSEDGLVLAARAVVADKALAEARGVVADAAARAVAALRVAVALEHVRARGALLQRAVGTAEAEVAHAADVLHRVPRGGVGLARLGRQLLLGVADAAARAVVGAHGALARDAVVVLEALALAALAVADGGGVGLA